jgi:hypothetical protein
MVSINFCQWITFQCARGIYGWNLTERLKDPALREEMREWSLRDNELAIGQWGFAWLMVGSIAVLPVSWALRQWAPQMFTGFLELLMLGPVAAILCLLEIYARWLIGLLSPQSPVALPGGPSLLEGKSLLASSLATFTLLLALYVPIDRIVASSVQ